MGTIIFLFGIALKAGAVWYCTSRAKKLGRSEVGWGIFGFIMPVIAMIAITASGPVAPAGSVGTSRSGKKTEEMDFWEQRVEIDEYERFQE